MNHAVILFDFLLLAPVAYFLIMAAGYATLPRGPHRPHADGKQPMVVTKRLFVSLCVLIVLALLITFHTQRSLPTGQTRAIAAFAALGTLSILATRRLNHSFNDVWECLKLDYRNPAGWTSIKAEPHLNWRWSMKWWFIEHPEPLDQLTVVLMRRCRTLADLKEIIASKNYPDELITLLRRKHWGQFRENVDKMISSRFCNGVFSAPGLLSIGLSPEAAYQDLRSGLLCNKCTGRGTVNRRRCQECHGTCHPRSACPMCSQTGYINIDEVCPRCAKQKAPTANCTGCRGTGVNTIACPNCSGMGMVMDVFPVLFMKRLQYYWVVYTTGQVDSLKDRLWSPGARAAVFSFGVCFYAVVAYQQRSGAGHASIVTLGDFVKALYTGSALLAVYTAATVVLAVLLMFEGTSTLSLVRPLRNPVVGDPIWTRIAQLGILAGTASFASYSVGISLLGYGDDLLRGHLSLTAIILIAVAFMFSATLVLASILKVRSLMFLAKESRMRELESQMRRCHDKDVEWHMLLEEFEKLSALSTGPLSNQMRAEIGAGFLLPLIIQLGAVFLQAKLAPAKLPSAATSISKPYLPSPPLNHHSTLANKHR